MGITVNQVSDGFLIPKFTEFGIYDFGDEKDIYSIHFDFKQLITHISGMINQNINGKLNYIFFTPDIAYNGTDKIIDKLYSELKTEVAAIEKSGFVRNLKEYGIELAFGYCPVSKFVIELV